MAFCTRGASGLAGQGEKLDGFMREQQQREALLGKAAREVSLAGRRDDDAARAVFASKALSLRELRASTTGC